MLCMYMHTKYILNIHTKYFILIFFMYKSHLQKIPIDSVLFVKGKKNSFNEIDIKYSKFR